MSDPANTDATGTYSPVTSRRDDGVVACFGSPPGRVHCFCAGSERDQPQQYPRRTEQIAELGPYVVDLPGASGGVQDDGDHSGGAERFFRAARLAGLAGGGSVFPVKLS